MATLLFLLVTWLIVLGDLGHGWGFLQLRIMDQQQPNLDLLETAVTDRQWQCLPDSGSPAMPKSYF